LEFVSVSWLTNVVSYLVTAVAEEVMRDVIGGTVVMIK